MPRNRKSAHKSQHPNNLHAQFAHAQTELIPLLEFVSVGDLKPSPKNPRSHSKKQIRELARSMQEFGYTVPALIDEGNRVLAGHGRLEAAKLVGLTTIPCVRVTHMSEAQKRAYVIADNQLALKAGWDEDFLAEELEALMGLEPNFDLSLTGFSIPEIDGLIAGHKPEKPGNPDDDLLPDPSQVPSRCKPGDIFRLGRHRLICGDARDYSTVAALMDGELARMVFTDPPYNVPIAGNVGGLGKIQHGEFAMASGEMTRSEFTAILLEDLVIKRIKEFLKEPKGLSQALPQAYQSAAFQMHLDAGAEKLLAKLEQNPATCWSELILNFLTRVQVHRDRVEMQLNSYSIAQSIFGNKATSTSDDNDAEDKEIILTITATLKRTGKELRFVIPGAADQTTPDQSLIRLLQRAHALQLAIEQSGSASIEEIASSQNMTPSYATRLMRLNYLAPDIAAAILDGNQPVELSAKRLMKDTRYPLGWHEQRIALGFAQA